jgi:hypothetical protein
MKTDVCVCVHVSYLTLLAIPAIKWLQTYTSDCTATGIDVYDYIREINHVSRVDLHCVAAALWF